jgi:glycosyltransferase involved in cell wall biosynthesis
MNKWSWGSENGVLALIAIVRSNSLIYDSRIMKNVHSLNKRYTVLAIGWNREGRKLDQNAKQKNVLNQTNSSAVIPKIFTIRAPFARPSLTEYIPLIAYFPMFWGYILFNLLLFRPNIVHACDLDTALPCYIYKVLFQKKMIFDVFDRYAMTFIPRKHTILYYLLNELEEAMSGKADVLVTVGDKILDTFRKRPTRCQVIMNCMEDYYYSEETGHKERQENDPTTLSVVYTGPITQGRGLQTVSEVIKDIENVKLIMMGPLVDKKLLDELLLNPRVEYKGFLESIPDYFHAVLDADILIALYSGEIPSLGITTHNKVYEAMMCEKPIITNVSRDLIAESQFGLVVDYDDKRGIRSAIVKLKNDGELRKHLGKNGRNAFLRKYNWGACEKELFGVYETLSME